MAQFSWGNPTSASPKIEPVHSDFCTSRSFPAVVSYQAQQMACGVKAREASPSQAPRVTSRRWNMIHLPRSRNRMTIVAGLLIFGVLASGRGFAQPAGGGVEPRAGMWNTWVLASGRQRVLPPPDRVATAAEISELRALAAR